LLALKLQHLSAADFNLDLTGFDAQKIDALLAVQEERDADTPPPLPENPVSRAGDLWICGPKKPHRILCGDFTNAEAVARLLGDRKYESRAAAGRSRISKPSSGRGTRMSRGLCLARSDWSGELWLMERESGTGRDRSSG
jgi:hypothetical protein